MNGADGQRWVTSGARAGDPLLFHMQRVNRHHALMPEWPMRPSCWSLASDCLGSARDTVPGYPGTCVRDAAALGAHPLHPRILTSGPLRPNERALR